MPDHLDPNRLALVSAAGQQMTDCILDRKGTPVPEGLFKGDNI